MESDETLTTCQETFPDSELRHFKTQGQPVMMILTLRIQPFQKAKPKMAEMSTLSSFFKHNSLLKVNWEGIMSANAEKEIFNHIPDCSMAPLVNWQR